MKTFKQFNESVLDYLHGKPFNTRQRYGAFGTDSPDIDVKNPYVEAESKEAPFELNLHTLIPKSRGSSVGENAKEHFQNILSSAGISRKKGRVPSRKRVTYVPLDNDYHDPIKLHSLEAGFSSLQDLVQHHLHHKAEEHLGKMQEMGKGLGKRYTRVAVFHSDETEPHPDYSNVHLVHLKNRGFTKGSVLNWNPVTGHPNFRGKVDTHPDKDPGYEHQVELHNYEVAPSKTKTRRSVRSVVSNVFRRRKAAAKA